MSLEIRPVGPFDLPLTLSFLSGFGPMRGEQTVGTHEVIKAFAVGERAVAVRVGGSDRASRPIFSVEVFSDRPLEEAEAREARSRVEAMLTTYEDVTPFYERAAEDVSFAPLVSRFRGLHHVRFPSPFEAACWGVINQRIGLAAALAALARSFAETPASFLRDAPIVDVRAWLRAIHGVGPFTSSFVLYRGLGRFDGATRLSPKLVAAAERQYGRQLGSTGVARLAERYGEWGGLWMLYLWASRFVPAAAS